jgi:hypothetical protein
MWTGAESTSLSSVMCSKSHRKIQSRDWGSVVSVSLGRHQIHYLQPSPPLLVWRWKPESAWVQRDDWTSCPTSPERGELSWPGGVREDSFQRLMPWARKSRANYFTDWCHDYEIMLNLTASRVCRWTHGKFCVLSGQPCICLKMPGLSMTLLNSYSSSSAYFLFETLLLSTNASGRAQILLSTTILEKELVRHWLWSSWTIASTVILALSHHLLNVYFISGRPYLG